MLCEKCKNKKPTVFFTDTGGINHSLCAFCASSFNNSPSVSENTAADVLFSPESCIIHKPILSSHTWLFADKNFVCEACKTTSEQMDLSGEFGCPVCAKEMLEKNSLCTNKIPRRIRTEKERSRSISELQRRLNEALSQENYEGAASLRDQIRKLKDAK